MNGEKEGKNMAAPVFKNDEIKFKDFSKLEKFAKYANEKNPANQKIQRMLKDHAPIPMRKKTKK